VLLVKLALKVYKEYRVYKAFRAFKEIQAQQGLLGLLGSQELLEARAALVRQALRVYKDQ
jgi:hypothetical protein